MTHPAKPTPALIARAALGGVLMGLANLVPGISGGTMLLAAGVYTLFITGIAEVTTLRFRAASVIVLGTVVLAAAVAVALLAGVVRGLVIEHRWVMYSLFIGLTLGGAPLLWKLIGRTTTGVWVGVLAGFACMATLAIAQTSGAHDGGSEAGTIRLFLAGVAGASAMILPGVSGAYLLLVLGCYLPLLAGIDQFKDGLSARDMDIILQSMRVVIPVGIGVVVGVVAVSNVLKWLLTRYEKPTLGVLLGLLLGAVVGLWPFHTPLPLDRIERVKGQTVLVAGDVLVFEANGEAVDVEDYPTQPRRPAPTEAAASLALIVAGCVVTSLVARLGRDKKEGES